MQRYTEIPGSATLSESLPLILNNDKTSLSCSAGTAFPTVNVQQGMLCFRTDQNKLYQCVTAMEPYEWRCVADANGNARNLDGGEGNAIDYDKQNLNDWEKMPTGFYEGSNMLNSPSGDTAWRIIQIRQGNSDGYSTQLAFGKTTGRMFTRFQSGGIWSDWNEVYTGSGDVVTGMNADKLDGYDAGNESAKIPINNNKLNVNLNADKLDGYDAGNKSGNIPISNGIVNVGLNADQLDGYHAGNESGNVPVSNGKVNKNLNAEMVGGVKVENLLAKGQDGAVGGTIEHATFNNLTVNNFTARDFEASEVKTSQSTVSNISGDLDSITSSGGGDTSSVSYYIHTKPSIEKGSYNLYSLIQGLIRCSHYHIMEKTTRYSNCKCDCRCACDCTSTSGDSDTDG